MEGPRSSTTTTTSPRSTTRPGTRRGCSRTPSTSSRTPRCCCAPTPRRCRCARWRRSRRRSSSIVPGKVYRRDSDATHSPMFHQVEGLAVGEGITLADLQGTLDEMLRAIFGAGREARMRPHFFPSPSRASSSTSPASSATAPATLAGGERCNLCKGIGWIEIGGAGMVDPNVLGFVAGERLRPRAGPGLRLRHGDRADRDAEPRRPRPAPLLRQRRARAGAVLMRVPYSWLREHCDPGSAPRSSPSGWR